MIFTISKNILKHDTMKDYILCLWNCLTSSYLLWFWQSSAKLLSCLATSGWSLPNTYNISSKPQQTLSTREERWNNFSKYIVLFTTWKCIKHCASQEMKECDNNANKKQLETAAKKYLKKITLLQCLISRQASSATNLFSNYQCPFTEWFGFFIFATFAIQHSKIV